MGSNIQIEILQRPVIYTLLHGTDLSCPKKFSVNKVRVLIAIYISLYALRYV